MATITSITDDMMTLGADFLKFIFELTKVDAMVIKCALLKNLHAPKQLVSLARRLINKLF